MGIKLTQYQIRIMKHAIGYDPKRVKRGKYIAWRNYFASYSDVEDLEDLVKQGLAVKSEKDKNNSMNYYYVTDNGFKFLSDVLGVKIVDDES